MIDGTEAVRETARNLDSAARMRAAFREVALGLMTWQDPPTIPVDGTPYDQEEEDETL